jgi:hypothetical protein
LPGGVDPERLEPAPLVLGAFDQAVEVDAQVGMRALFERTPAGELARDAERERLEPQPGELLASRSSATSYSRAASTRPNSVPSFWDTSSPADRVRRPTRPDGR